MQVYPTAKESTRLICADTIPVDTRYFAAGFSYNIDTCSVAPVPAGGVRADGVSHRLVPEG